MEKIKNMTNEVPNNEDVLFEDNRSLEDIVREVAEEEGLTYEETMAMFKKGMGMINRKTSDSKKKAKAKAKRKQAKKSRKKNRK